MSFVEKKTYYVAFGDFEVLLMFLLYENRISEDVKYLELHNVC